MNSFSNIVSLTIPIGELEQVVEWINNNIGTIDHEWKISFYPVDVGDVTNIPAGTNRYLFSFKLNEDFFKFCLKWA
jgi:hypothetical protein